MKRSHLSSLDLLISPPGHGAEPRDAVSVPYKVLLSSHRVSGGEKINVSLSGSGFLTSTELKGFLMQASVLCCVSECLTVSINYSSFHIDLFPH